MKLRLYLKSYNTKFEYDLSSAHFALTSPKQIRHRVIESLTPAHVAANSENSWSWGEDEISHDTVDGRNPAPLGMYKTLVNNGQNYQPQLVQDVFHQQHHEIRSRVIYPGLPIMVSNK